MRENWYSQDILDTALGSPGIYEWRIEGIGIYVGKADVTVLKRIGRYPKNVAKMLAGDPWHGDSTKKYRPIHEALLIAHDQGLPVSVSILETCSGGEALALERKWIARRRAEALSGGPAVLNGIEGRKALVAFMQR